MNIATFITNWIAAGNRYNTEKYIQFFLPDAVLDDPSVGRAFEKHKGIRDYFTSYFIGYNTQTRLLNLTFQGNKAFVEVEFTGDFPQRRLRGTFDLVFKDEKIAFVKADLIL